MPNYLNRIYDSFKKSAFSWAKDHFLQIFIFNIILMLLFLLRSVGYFYPYIPLSVNFIVVFALILSIFLLNANSSALFIVALLFWILASFLRIVAVEVWAERTALYCFQSLVIGLVLMIKETLVKSKTD